MYPQFQEMGIDWLALSVDTPESLRRMRDRHSLTFRVLPDPQGQVALSYGCMWSKERKFNEPAVFLINRNGLLIYQALVSTANGLAPAADVMEHLLWRIEGGRMLE